MKITSFMYSINIAVFFVLIFSVKCMSMVIVPKSVLKITGEVSRIVFVALGYLISFVRY